MDELINLIVQKTGISQENARKAAQTAIDFLKTKLPAPVAGQVDAVLAGDMSGVAGQAGEMLNGKLGGARSADKNRVSLRVPGRIRSCDTL